MADWGYRYKTSLPEHFWLIVFAIVVLGGVIAVSALAPGLQGQQTLARLFNLADTPTPTVPPTATPAPTRTPKPTPTGPPAATATLTSGELLLRIGTLIQQAQEPWDKHDWPQAINLLLAAHALDPKNPDATQKLYMAYYLYDESELSGGKPAECHQTVPERPGCQKRWHGSAGRARHAGATHRNVRPAVSSQ